MTKGAAKGYGGDGIRVNAVCPAMIDTAMLSLLTEDADYLSQAIARNPLGRVGQPLEVAKAVVWLSSDAASFVTGVALPVDGGFIA